MTLIVLTVLATGWLGYFALWYRERRAAQPVRRDSMANFNRSLDALSAGVPSDAFASDASASDASAAASNSLGDLFDAPRTPQQALRRRCHIVGVFVSVAVLALLAVPVFRAGALAVHVLADLGLLLFIFGAVYRRDVVAAEMAEVRVLYRSLPEPGEMPEIDSPLGRAAGG